MANVIQDIKPYYKWIVDSVISKARPDFLQEGVDEKILEELKIRWEAKLLESGVFNAAEGEVDEEEAGEGARDAAANAKSGANSEDGAADAEGEAAQAVAGDPDASAGDAAAAEGPGSKRKASESPSPATVVKQLKKAMKSNPADATIPQNDGAGDSDTSAAAAGDDNEAGSSGRVRKAKGDKHDNAEDDLSNHESEDDDEQEDIRNLVLAQYEKVARTKSRWKCHMKQGIVHIDGREYLFAKATGEFQF